MGSQTRHATAGASAQPSRSGRLLTLSASFALLLYLPSFGQIKLKGLLAPSRFSVDLPDLRPAFDLKALRDPSSLQVKVVTDQVIDSLSRPGKKVRRIELTYRSQQIGGEEWRHRCVAFVPHPAVAEEKRGLAGIVLERNASYGASALDVDRDFGEAATIDLGVPTLLVGDNPGEHFGISDENMLMAYCYKKFLDTNDVRWHGLYQLGVVALTAITALGSLLSFDVKEVVLCGSGPRAASLYLVASVDDRIRGIMPCGFDQVNLDSWRECVKASEEVLSPSEQAWVETARCIDITPYLASVKAATLVVSGTNDRTLCPRFLQPDFYYDLKQDKALALVANHGRGISSSRHAANWRMWLQRCLFGRRIPEVRIRSAEFITDIFRVRARVSSKAPPARVTLFYTHDFRRDPVRARWHQVQMQRKGKEYVTDLRVTDRNLAYFVEVEDDYKGIAGYTTSMPYEHPRR